VTTNGSRLPMPKPLGKTRVESNNAIFSLPDIVAKAERYFEQEGQRRPD
jgi:hypothetical protein